MPADNPLLLEGIIKKHAVRGFSGAYYLPGNNESRRGRQMVTPVFVYSYPNDRICRLWAEPHHALASKRAFSFFAAVTDESVSSVRPHSFSSRSMIRS